MTTGQVKHAVRLHEWSQMIKNCQESAQTVSEWRSKNGITTCCYYYRLAQVRKAVLESRGLSAGSTTDVNEIPILVKIDMP